MTAAGMIAVLAAMMKRRQLRGGVHSDANRIPQLIYIIGTCGMLRNLMGDEI